MGDIQKAGATATSLKERLGEVFEEIFAKGRRAGREEGYKAGLAEGARIERERILAMCGQPPPGDEAVTGDRAADGATGGAEVAKATGTLSKIKQVLAAETAKATDQLSKFMGDMVREPLPASTDHGGQRAGERGPSIEARCKAEWEREPGLRAEFGTLEAYREFVRQREAGSLGS